MKGRKRQIVVDTVGTLIRTLVHPANEHDKTAIRSVIMRIPVTSQWRRVVMDAGYDTPAAADFCRRIFDVDYEIVKRTGKGFEVLPRRWVVERTFAWFGKYRRLSKDYEALPVVSEALLYVASIHLLTRRIVKMSF